MKQSSSVRRAALGAAWLLGATGLISIAGAPAAAAPADDLFISEYVEGSGFNKAIELYNGTGADIDLAAGVYTLELYSNGNAAPNTTTPLAGVVADGDAFVLANSQATFPSDMIASAVNFNGDDAIVLRKDGVVIDSFGQAGVDPGSSWPGGGADVTLRRLPAICAGDTNETDAFDASVEWASFPSDTLDGLGSHTADCGTPASAGDLFISEYVEGSGFNKAIELYNGTGADIDLAAGVYTLELYSNGNAAPNTTTPLAGVVADGDAFVLANSQATFPSDMIASAVNFNGDDAIVLRKDGVVIDSFGQAGVDPGSSWPGGGADVTLRRLPAICAGDTNETDAFDASVEWASFLSDTLDGLGSHTADCGTPAEPTILINEFDADQVSTDSAEFIELTDGGFGGTDLSGLTMVLYNGSNNLSYDAVDLDGVTTNADGYAVICANAATVANCDLDVSPDTNWIQNGADAIAVYEADATAFPNGTAVTLDGLVDAAVYGTSDADDAELLVLLEPGQPQVDENANGAAVTESNQRCPDSSGAARSTDTYEQWSPTPGTANVCEIVIPPLDCSSDTPITLISAVQGSGATSPIEGDTVVIEGVVTSILTNLNKITVQEEDADNDADPLTSEGIVIFGGTLPDGLVVGTTVRVEGTVSEYETSGGASSQTEISPTVIVACDDPIASVAATPVTLPFGSEADREAIEGMLVTLPQDLVIAEYFNFDRFGEVVVSSERLLTPTAEFEPGPDAIAAAAANSLDRLTIDDGNGSQNPDPSIHPGNGNVFDLTNLFRGGDTIGGITGVIEESFGLYRMQPTQYGTFTEQNPRPAAPADVGGDITVASFNVLNYFTTIDDGTNDICGPSQTLECRGADDANELDRQRDKIVAAIDAIDADVVGLIEIENNVNDDAVIDLVDSLNAVAGAGTYAAIDTGTIGTDAIKVAFIYQPASVSPVGGYAILDESVDPRFIDAKNRPVLAQTFSDNATGGAVTVAVNHLKSKGSACDDVGDPNTGDGSGNCNGVRTAAAEALVDWLATDPTGSGDPDMLVIGDLNSYDKETPIDAIIAGADDTVGTADDYTDLLALFEGEAAYSYVFDGQTGYLDHALANESLLAQVTGTTAWHINADEPDALDYDTSFKKDAQDAIYAPDAYRSSDHDPVIIGLSLAVPVEPFDVDHALIHVGRRGGGKLILRGSVDTSFDECPTFSLAVDEQAVIDTGLSQIGRLCLSWSRTGLVWVDRTRGTVTVVVNLPSDFSLADATVDFDLTLDDVDYAAEVDGRQFGRIWIA